MTLLRLFWSFFQIGLFSFGGGYAALPLIQHQVVEQNGWLTISQFTDIITISQMTPGPIALNSATFVGIQIAGLPGALIATLGCILPSCIVALTLAWFYYKYRNLSLIKGVLQGLRPAVVALIASSGLSILLRALLAGNRLLSGVDFVAVSIGTFHGVYEDAPRLNIDLLKALAARISAPLVLHGSSYTPDDQLAEAVRHGISKINVATEVSDTMIRATLEHTRSLEKVKYANQLTDAPYQAVTELVRHKIRLFGGSGKA